VIRLLLPAALLLALVPSAHGADVLVANPILLDLDRRLHLDAPGIASQYASSEKRSRDTLGWTDLSVQPGEAPREFLSRALFTAQLHEPPPEPTFEDSTVYEAEFLTAAGLRKVRRKLIVDVAAYDANDANKAWEGLETAGDADQRGRTVDISDGVVQGDLTVGVGTSAATTSVGDVLEGEAEYLDLNPLRDVSAQFDILFRVGDRTRNWGFNAFVIRLRAAYKGAFNGVNSDPADDEATDSEFSVSFGVAW
jgi:hypothetical protein